MLLLAVLAIAIIFFLMQYSRKQIAHAIEKAALQHTFENQLLQSRLEAQEQSFKYFSEEIHDNVGQILSVVGMHLYQIQEECEGPRGRLLAEQSSELLNKAIDDLRTISHTLNAGYISKAGLVETLKKELAYINSVKSADCRLDVHGEPRELGANRQTLLFRILQEAIGNALKHAQASVITVSLTYSGNTLAVTVQDNGNGFQPTTAATATSGLGLSNMQLRAGLLGGTLQLDSRPGQGTTLSLTIDIQTAEK